MTSSEKGRRARTARRQAEPAGKPGRRPSLATPRWALFAVAVVLFLTTDDRHFGRISDGKQMARTAIALAETGGIGQTWVLSTTLRPGGDAVSRYGMGMSLLQVPAALLAPAVEKGLGLGTSQPLFLVAPFVLVLLAAAAAGWAAAALGGSPRAQGLAIVLTGLGSHLGSCASSDLSEPLQAAALGGAFAAALSASTAATERSGLAKTCAAGFLAGVAVLSKSVLVVAAPFCLLPLLSAGSGSRRLRNVAAAAAGAVPGLATWLAFEVIRFGRPFASHGGEGFSHPLLDGLWRLLVGPNRGLLLFFPALVPALLASAAALRASPVPSAFRRAAAGSALLASGSLLVVTAAWWGWHGAIGWGPRYLAPAVPLLAPWAALAMERWKTTRANALLAASVLLNAPPLLVHPSIVDGYQSGCSRPDVEPAFARTMPPFLLSAPGPGRQAISPIYVLPDVPLAAPHVVTPWIWRVSWLGDPSEAAAALARPPWLAARPDIRPRPFAAGDVRRVAPPPRWNVLGRGFFTGLDDPAAVSVYLDGLADQILRCQVTGDLALGLRLATKFEEIAPGGDADQLMIESLRLLGQADRAADFAARLGDRRYDPRVALAEAFLARDRGDDRSAAQLMGFAARALPGDTAARLARTSPSAWPGALAPLLVETPPASPAPR